MFVPVAGETDTTPRYSDFDPQSLELENPPSPYAEFYDDDLEKLVDMDVKESTRLWSHANDVTYEVSRIS